MAEKIFIHIAAKATFTAELQTKYANSIVFIKDSQEIFTHGTFYAIPDTYKDKITDLESAVAALQAAKAFSKISDGTNVAESPSSAGTIKFTGAGATSVSVSADGVKITSTNTTYAGGTGITLNGTTFNHTNAVTAGTAQGDASKTLTFGGTFAVPTVTYDAQGHVTSKGTTTMTMPANPDTHHQSNLVLAGSAAAGTDSSTATTNESTFLTLVENGNIRNAKQLTGTGKVTVTTINGKLTIDGADATVATGTNNGQVKIDGQDVSVKGLGTAAYTATTAYATAAQGTKADNAVPNTRTINGNALNADITLTKTDVGLGNVTNESKATMFASPAFTGVPTASVPPKGASTNQIATAGFVQSEISDKISAAQALRFKGTIGTGGDVTTLPAIHDVGDTYVVATAGNYAGEGCEPGDMIICTIAGTAAKDSDWSVVQRNLDGAVTGKSLTANTLLLGNGNSAIKSLANGSTGQVLKIVSGIPAWAAETVYTLPTASSTVKGGILIGYTENGKNYPVELDGASKAFVNVPWTNDNTTYTFASGSAGSFSVTPSGGTAQTVSIGKPATATTADKVANALTISLNGTAQTAFTGASAVTFNITAASIGAAAVSHNQASNTITAMTGYAKAATVSAIAVSDSLNAAIGKLEAMWDWEEL